MTMNITAIPVLSGSRGLLGHVAEMREDRLTLLRRAARELDDIGRLRFLHRHVLLLNTPALVHEVLVEKAKSFDKPLATRVSLTPLVGDGLLSSKTDTRWRRRRRIVAPLFSHAESARFGEVMVHSAVQVASRWNEGAVIPVMREATRIAMAVITACLFSTEDLELADTISKPLTGALEWTGHYGTSPAMMGQLVAHNLLRGLSRRLDGSAAARLEKLGAWLEQPFLVPGARTSAMRADLARIEERLLPLVTARRAAGGTKSDLLELLLRACEQEGHLSDRELRDEVVTFFVAGNETTASGITWALSLLDRNPAVLSALEREVDALGGRRPTVEDLPRLALCAQAFKEALRLYPPIYLFARESVEDVVIGRYHVPAGTSVYIAPYMIHRDPALYPDPERFDPARFTPEAEAARPRLAWMPFGAGPRVCVGAAFAHLEGTLVLATLLQRFRFERVEDRPVDPLPFITLRPAWDLPMRVRRREPIPG
ncbi:cytochrome P450 [Polyangium mundeleinium]|uniref:Cytochrome P450 n=1 Tax=Polyangium mundeleinium TaxID=2995306 RepID=A0ABT5ENX7_9BACT|nr:cytochrome P450 [Polyangium mundeleinium]MDC0743552.1 cytochrome P450 [Polyangium mundeleinium]